MSIDDILNDGRYAIAEQYLFNIKKDISSKPIVIFGCGNLGKKIGNFLLSKDTNLVAYSDNNESKWGSNLNGVPILSPAKAEELYGTVAIFIICIWSPERSYAQFKKQLSDLGIINIAHVAAIMLSFPGELLPYYSKIR